VQHEVAPACATGPTFTGAGTHSEGATPSTTEVECAFNGEIDAAVPAESVDAVETFIVAGLTLDVAEAIFKRDPTFAVWDSLFLICFK